MDYVDLSGDLTSTESTTLDGLATGAVPVKTTTGFVAATQDNIPAGTTNKPFVPAAVGAMAGVNITSGTATDVVIADTVTSGEAFTAGYGVGPKNSSGSSRWYRSSAASATAQICGGVAVETATAAAQAKKVQLRGPTDIIPNAAWDTLPTVAQVGLVVYASRTILGGFTLDVSAFTTADVKQPVGILASGGTGACTINLMIQALLGMTTSVREVAVTDLVFTPAYLTGANDAETTIATWRAVTAGSFAITINGSARTISALNFSTDSTMANVATRLQNAIRAATGALETCVWSTDHFVISSVSTANTSAVTVTSATGAGTDISGAAGGSRFMSCNTAKGVVTARAHGVYTIAVSDQRLRIVATATDPVWLQLPTVASVGNAKQYVVVDTGYLSGTNAITLTHNGVETIANAAADITLAFNGGEVILTSDLVHTNWTKNVGSMAQLAAQPTALGLDALLAGTNITAFPAGSSYITTIQPGPLGPSEYTIPAGTTAAGAATLKLGATSTPADGLLVQISVRAPALGNTLTFYSDGTNKAIIARAPVIGATLANAVGVVFQYSSAAGDWLFVGFAGLGAT